MTRANVVSETKKKTTGACGCAEAAVDTCCELECFERPSYYCGHLLTDADLNQEQRYFLAKNKLYHRALDGHGVVCGLRLTCDPHCDGSIRIGEGYAIDDCGHDLVVCEAARFDVLACLKKKGWLVERPAPDPCAPEPEEPECEIRQCFHVIACYREEPGEFEAPQAAGCRPDLSGCEPTRIREAVCFDLLDELPDEVGPLEDLEARIRACFRLFSDGAFAGALEANLEDLATIAAGGAEIGQHQRYFDLFCKLRGLFLLHLDRCPDRYNCRLDDEVRRAAFPRDPREGWGHEKKGKYGDKQQEKQGGPSPEDYARAVSDAFCHLLGLAWRYAVSCALGEMLPVCREPGEASCVVLGTVEVVNGCLVRVCNCPRQYVWSFAHFLEVLLATLANPAMCRSREGETCCREIPFDCKWFLDLLAQDRRAAEETAAAPFAAFRDLVDSLRHGFDITRTDVFSPGIFLHRKVEDLQAGAERLGVQLKVEEAPASPVPFAIAEVLQTLGLQTRDEPVRVAEENGYAVAAHTVRAPEATLDPAERMELEARIARTQRLASEAEQKAAALATELEALQESEIELRADFLAANEQIADLQGQLATVLENPIFDRQPLDPTHGPVAGGGVLREEPAGRCAATTLAGEPCRNRPLEGSRFCRVHQEPEGSEGGEG